MLKAERTLRTSFRNDQFSVQQENAPSMIRKREDYHIAATLVNLMRATTGIDLGKAENVTGMTYVALSRVRNLSDLVIEPLTFERLQALKKSPNLQ